MKQAEKTKHTYNKIIASAIQEFSQNGYDNASLNAMCNRDNISKGLIYHNFKNKDELYLEIVKECFSKIVKYLKSAEYSNNDSWENMRKLLILRQEFFDKFEDYRNIFFSAILTPPKHLAEEIQDIRKEYDEFNLEKFKKLLKGMKLRKGITEEMATSYFIAYQEMFNWYFQSKIYNKQDITLISKEHDLKILPILDVILYGIVIEENEDTEIGG